MTDAPENLDWSGTSDGPAAMRARASLSVEQRVAWLDETIDLAAATGALAVDRARRQSEADAFLSTGRTEG